MPFRFVVTTWYVAIVTGRISLRAPEYSPISCSVRLVRRISSSRHCRAATVFVTRISVVVCDLRHRRGADQRLAGAAGQDDDAGAAVPEALDRLGLVGPQRPALLVQLDRVLLAVDVAGEVLGRPAELEQHLLEVARARWGGRRRSSRVVPGADQRHHLLAPQHLLQHRDVERAQHQAVRRGA